MRLAAPWGLAAAALIGPLVAWYVLRSRRPRQVVASTYLWSRAERTVAAAVPWQRFRGDVTFWLILLALLLGAFALARPYVPVPADLGDHTILVIDASGSMLADEDGPTRATLARRAGEELLARLSPGQEVSVVEAGARGRALVSATSDPAAATRALSAVRHTHGPADFIDAFTLAAALERPGQETVVHLLTDGAVPDTALASAPAGLRVTAVGKDRPNLAVTRVQATPQGAGQSEVLVQVRNFGLLPAKGRLRLLVDGQEVVEEAIDLGPRATRDLVLSVDGGEGAILVARIEATGTDVTGAQAVDALHVDDAGFAVLSSAQSTKVVLATPGNVFLAAALEAVEGVELTVLDRVPGPTSTDLAEADLLVIDRLPGPAAPTIPTLLLAPSTLPAGITDGGVVDLPALTFQAPEHPLLADVALDDVSIAEARRLDAPALTAIASAPGVPLIQAGRLDRVPLILIGFDLLQTNLPLQAAWPVFVANAVTWLTGPPAPAAASAGQIVTLSPPAGTEQIRILPPSGDPILLDAARPTTTLDQVGLWRAVWLGTSRPVAGEDGETTTTTGELGTRVIAVNGSLEEADLSRPRPDPVASGQRSPGNGAPDPGSRDVETGASSEGRQPVGPIILVAVLILALVEWLWSHRRRREAASSTRAAPARRARARTS